MQIAALQLQYYPLVSVQLLCLKRPPSEFLFHHLERKKKKEEIDV